MKAHQNCLMARRRFLRFAHVKERIGQGFLGKGEL